MTHAFFIMRDDHSCRKQIMTLDAPEEQGIEVVAYPTSLAGEAQEKASAERAE
jgi:hypothetical protein